MFTTPYSAAMPWFQTNSREVEATVARSSSCLSSRFRRTLVRLKQSPTPMCRVVRYQFQTNSREVEAPVGSLKSKLIVLVSDELS